MELEQNSSSYGQGPQVKQTFYQFYVKSLIDYENEKNKDKVIELILNQQMEIIQNSLIFKQFFETILKNNQKPFRYEVLEILLDIIVENKLVAQYLDGNFLQYVLNQYRDQLDLQIISTIINVLRISEATYNQQQYIRIVGIMLDIIQYIFKKPSLNYYEQFCIKEYKQHVNDLLQNRLYTQIDIDFINDKYQQYLKYAAENLIIKKIFIIYINIIQFCYTQLQDDCQFLKNPTLIEIYFYYIQNMISLQNPISNEQQTSQTICQLLELVSQTSQFSQENQIRFLSLFLQTHLLKPIQLFIQEKNNEYFTNFNCIQMLIRYYITNPEIVDYAMGQFDQSQIEIIINNILILNSADIYYKLGISLIKSTARLYQREFSLKLAESILNQCLIKKLNTLSHQPTLSIKQLVKVILFIAKSYEIQFNPPQIRMLHQILNKYIIIHSKNSNALQNIMYLSITIQKLTSKATAIHNLIQNPNYQQLENKLQSWLEKVLGNNALAKSKSFSQMIDFQKNPSGFQKNQSGLQLSSVLQNKSQVKGKVGFNNMGQTCYMNSFLQCLYASTYLRRYLTQLYKKQFNSTEQISNKKICQFMQIIAELFTTIEQKSKSNDCSSLDLNLIVQNYPNDELKQKYNTQQDAQEYLLKFLDFLSFDTSILNMFNIKILSKITCHDCQQEQKDFNNKFRGELDVKLHFTNEEYQNPSQTISLLEMLIRNFKDVEFIQQGMDKSNTYYCEFCKKKSSHATQKYQPRIIPPHLILTLCRYEYDIETSKPKKIVNNVQIQQFITYQQIFQSTTSLDNNQSDEYYLYCIICHKGQTTTSGHYISIIRDLDENQEKWYCYDDSSVSQVDGDLQQYLIQLSDSDPKILPYILFYRNLSGYPLIID